MEKDYLKLVDGTTITIDSQDSLGAVRHIAGTESDALAVIARLTSENIKHLEFWTPDALEPYGVYDNVVLAYAPTRAINEDQTITVTIGFRVETDLEKRVRVNEEDITDLEVALAEVYESIIG